MKCYHHSWICDLCQSGWVVFELLEGDRDNWRVTLVLMMCRGKVEMILWCLVAIWLLHVLVLWCLGFLAIVGGGMVGVKWSLSVLAKATVVGWCVGCIAMLGVLMMIYLLVVVQGMLLVLWLGVWHVRVVGLCVYGSEILMDKGLWVASLTMLLGVRCWTFWCLSRLAWVV